MTSLKQRFLAEVRAEIAKYRHLPLAVFTEEDLAPLPLPVQRYFNHCGYVGREKIWNAQVDWEEVYLKMAPEKNWTPIDCYQFNSVPEPARIVYMKSSIAGFIPFEGRDKYQDGHGNMRIELLKLFRVSDAKGLEMDESALVTVLAEALFIPSYALQPYIRWTPLDEKTAKATIRHHGTEVGGIFHFNAQGECLRFDTDDRNWTQQDGTYKKVKWSAYIDSYTILNGIRIPSRFRALWHTPDGDYEYFKGTIGQVEYNIPEYSLEPQLSYC